MATAPTNSPVIRFGAYEADPRTGELRKHGLRIKLQDQPFQILVMLLERPGELVTREQIQQKLWPGDTFVDFDHGLNAAIRRLRDALSDSADNPRFIETLPRRGYRFLADVQSGPANRTAEVIPISAPAPHVGGPAEVIPGGGSQPAQAARMHRSSSLRWYLTGAAAVLAIVALAMAGLGWRTAAASNQIDSIAILPFANETREPSLDYLATGVAESVMDNLTQLPGLKVSSRSSAQLYRGRTVDAKTVARDLHVRAVLLGGIRPATPVSTDGKSENLSLSLELVDAQDGSRLWAGSYVFPRWHCSMLQADISTHVLEKLKLHLAPELRRRAGRRQTESDAAFDAEMRGRFQLQRRTNESFREAIDYFQQALDQDPNYALANAGLSSAYGLLAFYGGMSPAEANSLAEAFGTRALQLDPNLSDAHTQRGYLLLNFRRDARAAEQQFIRGIQLQPQSAEALHGYALFLAAVGRTDEAIAETHREMQEEIGAAGGTLVWVNYFGHHFQDMAELLPAFQGNTFWDNCWHGLLAEATGHFADAARLIEKAHPAVGQVCSLPQAYALAGRRADARKLLDQMIQGRRTGYVSGYQIALVYAALGQKREMLQWLHAAERESDPWMTWLPTDPRFDAFRSLPEFSALEKSVFVPR